MPEDDGFLLAKLASPSAACAAAEESSNNVILSGHSVEPSIACHFSAPTIVCKTILFEIFSTSQVNSSCQATLNGCPGRRRQLSCINNGSNAHTFFFVTSNSSVAASLGPDVHGAPTRCSLGRLSKHLTRNTPRSVPTVISSVQELVRKLHFRLATREIQHVLRELHKVGPHGSLGPLSLDVAAKPTNQG